MQSTFPCRGVDPDIKACFHIARMSLATEMLYTFNFGGESSFCYICALTTHAKGICSHPATLLDVPQHSFHFSSFHLNYSYLTSALLGYTRGGKFNSLKENKKVKAHQKKCYGKVKNAYKTFRQSTKIKIQKHAAHKQTRKNTMAKYKNKNTENCSTQIHINSQSTKRTHS